MPINTPVPSNFTADFTSSCSGKKSRQHGSELQPNLKFWEQKGPLEGYGLSGLFFFWQWGENKIMSFCTAVIPSTTALAL